MDLDDDVLNIAKSLAQHRKQSLGKVISGGFRKGLQTSVKGATRNGLRVIQRAENSVAVTLDVVNKLRDEA